MRAVVQRVTRASVRVEDEIVGEITRRGLLVLLGVGRDDDHATADKLAEKIWALRIFEELSASDLGAPILVVSQFTLYADIKKGRRPSWSRAAPGADSSPMVDYFVRSLQSLGAEVATGVFGADMAVELVNDGPVTIMIDTDIYR